MPTKTNEPDAAAMMRAFDLPADDWHGAGLRRRTGLPKDGNATRRNFSDGGLVDVWDVSSPGTPNSETDAAFREIHTRRDCAFSSSDMGALGKPTKPGKP